jgi:hypothetical protein
MPAGAVVLGDLAVTLRVERLHAMQFRPALKAEVKGRSPAQRSSPSNRECPLDTAGDRCLWHVGGTAGENDDGPRLAATAPSSTGG